MDRRSGKAQAVAVVIMLALGAFVVDAFSQSAPDACANLSLASFGLGLAGAPAGIPSGQHVYAAGPFFAGDTFTVTANGIIPGHPSIPEPGDTFALFGDNGVYVGPVTVYGGTIVYTTPVDIDRIGIVNNTAVDFVLIASATCVGKAGQGQSGFIPPAPFFGRLSFLVLLVLTGMLGARALLRPSRSS